MALVLLLCLSVALVPALAATLSRHRRQLCKWSCLRSSKNAFDKEGMRADADGDGGGRGAASANSRPTRVDQSSTASSPLYRQLALSVSASASPEPLPVSCELPDASIRVLASPSKHSLLYLSDRHSAIPVVRAPPPASITCTGPVAATADTDSCNGSLSQATAMGSLSSREPLLLPLTSHCCQNELSFKVRESMTRSFDSSTAFYEYVRVFGFIIVN